MILLDLVAHAAGLVGHLGPALPGLLGGIQAAGAGAADAAGALAGAVEPEAVATRLRFLSWAYTAVWLILAAYLLLLATRQRRLERQVRLLRDRVSPPGPVLRT